MAKTIKERRQCRKINGASFISYHKHLALHKHSIALHCITYHHKHHITSHFLQIFALQ